MKESYLYIGAAVLVVVAVVVTSVLASGKSERVPVIFTEDHQEEVVDDTHSTLVYFSNKYQDTDFRCSRVFEVEREIKDEVSYGRALDVLMLGPTAEELEEGYFSSLNGAEILSSRISEGVAYVTLSASSLSSCQWEAVESQIKFTLLEFDDIEEVIVEQGE